MAKRSLCWLSLCLLVLLPQPARAQAAHDVPGYREAIDEALNEYAAKNYLEARTLFARAHKLFPNARTLRGLGAVSFEQRNYGDSVSFLEQALASRTRPLEGTVREDTERLLARARAFVAQIELTVEPANAQLIVDGNDEPPRSPRTLQLEVGAHEIELRAPGYLPERRVLNVEGGERQSLSIDLHRTAGPVALSPTPRPVVPRKPWQSALGGTVTALGIGAFAAAVAFSVERHHRAEQFQLIIPQSAPDNGRYTHAYGRWDSARAAPYVLDAVGASLLTAGALTLLLTAEPEAFPWWASTLSASAGIGLVTWGLYDVAKGGSCGGNSLDLRPCSFERERRDRGALVSMAALPLLALPLAQLVRRLVQAHGSGESAFLLSPEISPAQRSFALRASLRL